MARKKTIVCRAFENSYQRIDLFVIVGPKPGHKFFCKIGDRQHQQDHDQNGQKPVKALELAMFEK